MICLTTHQNTLQTRCSCNGPPHPQSRSHLVRWFILKMAVTRISFGPQIDEIKLKMYIAYVFLAICVLLCVLPSAVLSHMSHVSNKRDQQFDHGDLSQVPLNYGQ